ncbi:MAG: LptF/LptG family permease [Treponema sp.]|nr:LptF/LptG family permease [Treponema sp.]
MSATLFRYIIKDTLFSFFVAFVFFFLIFFINQMLLMIQEILVKNVPFYEVILLCFYALPSVIALAAPFASLMGTLMTIGRLSADNEVLIMLTSGLSYRMIFLPALVVGIFISSLSFVSNDILLPAGTIQFTRLYRRILSSTPALELEANSVKRFRDTVIITGPVRGNSIENMIILDRTSDGERRVIMAQNAVLTDAGREGLSLDIAGAFIQSSKEVVRDDYDYFTASFLRYWVPQADLMQAVNTIGPREMSSIDVRREIDTRTAVIAERLDERYQRVLNQALILEEVLRQGPSHDDWNRRENLFSGLIREKLGAQGVINDRTLQSYRLEYYQKFTIPLGALSFVFLAVALGLMARKSGQTVGFILGLLVSVLYWSMLMGGRTLGMRPGNSPFMFMWLPNILALSVGLVLFTVRIRK